MAAVCHVPGRAVKRPPKNRFLRTRTYQGQGSDRRESGSPLILPPVEIWVRLDDRDRRALVDRLMAEKDVPSSVELADALERADWNKVLEHLGGHAARVMDMKTYTWALKARGVSSTRCGDRYARYLWKDPHGTMSWVDCGLRACSYCGPVRTWRESGELHRDLLDLGRDVYRVETDTIRRAHSVVDYATKLGHATVVVPAGPTRTVVYTTMPRKDAELVWAAPGGEETTQREVAREWSNPGFEARVFGDVSRIPAYRRDDPDKRAMRRNKHFRAILAEHTEPVPDEEPESAREPEGERGVMTQEALIFAVGHGMVTETWPSGEIKTVDTSHVDPAIKAEFLLLMRAGRT